MLCCHGFPALKDNMSYIFHVVPLGLFPELKFSSAKDLNCLGLCKGYFQTCPPKSSAFIVLLSYYLRNETLPQSSLRLHFMITVIIAKVFILMHSLLVLFKTMEKKLYKI